MQVLSSELRFFNVKDIFWVIKYYRWRPVLGKLSTNNHLRNTIKTFSLKASERGSKYKEEWETTTRDTFASKNNQRNDRPWFN